MLNRRLAILIGGICLSLAGAARAQDAKQSAPNPAATPTEAEEIGQVKVYRLHHAEAGAIVNELSQVLDSRRVRLAAYRTGNCVIVAGPSHLQGTMAKLIQRLDAPASANDVGAVSPPDNGKRTRTPPGNGPRPGGVAAGTPPATGQDHVIRVIRVPGRDLAALAQALAELAREREGGVRTVVVTPSRERERAQKASRPTDIQRR